MYPNGYAEKAGEAGVGENDTAATAETQIYGALNKKQFHFSAFGVSVVTRLLNEDSPRTDGVGVTSKSSR